MPSSNAVAVQEIGRNVEGVQGDAGNLEDLDRLFATVKAKKSESISCSPVPVPATSMSR
jgi:hypothetical protein